MKKTMLNCEVCRRFAMPKRIAVATNLTDSKRLLPYAVAQARLTGAHLCLIHALRPPLGGQTGHWLSQFGERRSPESEALDRLEDMQRAVQLKGVCCSIKMGHGDPCEVILESLQQSRIDRLIAGGLSRRYLREIMRGSVAKELMAGVTVPTLFVGPHVQPPAVIQNNSVLCVVSMQDDYQSVARFALLVGQMYQARVTLVHVMDNADAMHHADAEEWVRVALQQIIDEYATHKERARVDIRHGPLVDTVRQAAHDVQSDVIVVGTSAGPHKSSLKRLLAYQIMATAGCPVYCYRQDSVEHQHALDADAPAWSAQPLVTIGEA